ncbi:MAG TPA: nucleoside deaminase [Bacteroidales bacterium]|nr:nucleoside deaminase [Bacteroidales bacterium]
MNNVRDHEIFMKAALEEAKKALSKDEVPIGAVVVFKNTIIARAHNLTETLHDPTAHAEMQAITSAADWLGGKYLTGCSIYVTLEPCGMCAGALGWSQVSSLIFGAIDNKKGYRKYSSSLLHPKTNIITGILESECSEVIVEFFRKKR